MSCWYYSTDEIELRTPSRDDGVPLCVENRYRRDGARFIITASNTLGLRYETPATGVVFFHRFFMIQSFKQFNRWVVAAACLLLAGKVEETPKKCKDVLKVTQSILTEQQMANFGGNPKEELLTHERILLQTIKFDLQVQHPYSYLLKFAKSLKGDKQKMEKLVQTAWTFVNDSLSTVLCLQWEPQAIAVAFLYLAGKLAKFDLQSVTQSKNRSWWRQFVDTVDVHDLDTICHQVLDTYGDPDSSASQDEEESEPRPLTPHQTPPSTASIPPSLSVVQSGGVGHTTSTHLPLPTAMQTQQQVQQQPLVLTQQLQRPPAPTHQQLMSPQVPLANLQTVPLGSTVSAGTTVPLRPTAGAPIMLNPYQTFQSVPRPGIQPTQQSTLIASMPQAFSSLRVGMNATTSLQPLAPPGAISQTALLQLQQQQQQLQQLQQQQQQQQQQVHLQRGLTALPVRTGGSELTPPPAKRHAMEMPYRPGLPAQQHPHIVRQLPTGYPPQSQTTYPQQLGSQLQYVAAPPTALTLPMPPSHSTTPSPQLVLPTQGASAPGFPNTRTAQQTWQQK